MAGIPRLIKSDNGFVVEINSSPFTLGRSLSSNYVVPVQSVSRNHCRLEKVNESWILKDTSTNGTCLNGTVIKSENSPPLKDSDIIDLDRQNEKYVFHSAPTGDISDEQLCRVADYLLSKEEIYPNSCSTVQSSNTVPVCEHISAYTSVQTYTTVTSSTADCPNTEHGLQHGKRPKLLIPAPHQTNTSFVDLTNESGCDSLNIETGIVQQEAAGPSNQYSQEYTTKCEKPNNDKAKGRTSNQHSQEYRTNKEKPNDDKAKGRKPNKYSQEYTTKSKKPNDDENEGGPETISREDVQDEMQCSICSEMFVKAVTLNCAHTFCKFCIEAWRKNKDICPICRSKITSQSSTLVLDNIIERIVQKSSEEIKQHRKELLEDREKDEKQQSKRKGKENPNRAVPNNQSVIEVSSDDSDSDLTSEADWSEAYDEDDWYDAVTNGNPRAYYGGYGYCYCCGRRGHWANGCPYR